jgi:hypothetical protein
VRGKAGVDSVLLDTTARIARPVRSQISPGFPPGYADLAAHLEAKLELRSIAADHYKGLCNLVIYPHSNTKQQSKQQLLFGLSLLNI